MSTLKCKICHKLDTINTNDDNLYKSEIIIDNYICCHCTLKIKRIKLKLICKNCKTEFITRILINNKDKYNDWVCPKCSSNLLVEKKINVNKRMNCSICYIKRGVCNHSELNCSLANKLISFTSNFLYALKKSDDCSVLSIHNIDNSRKDIHAFKYTALFKNNYAISSNNLILIRQRLKSKKNFVTNIIIYKFDNEWKEILNNKFEREDNWIGKILDFVKSNNLKFVEKI